MRGFLRLSIALLAAGAGGCRSAHIEPVAFEQLAVCVATAEAGERVFRSDGEWQAFLRSGRITGQPVRPDFARVVVATKLDGAGSACVGYTVDDVITSNSRVVVRATRHVSSAPCIAVIAFPQFSVALEARDLPVEIRVREVDGQTVQGAPACF